jgi:lysophospholipase L1-like esterase
MRAAALGAVLLTGASVAQPAIDAGARAMVAEALARSRAAPLSLSREVAQFGDSRTDEGGSGTSVNESLGYQAYAELFAGGRVTLPPDLNFGVSGDTTAQMVARLPAVAASRASVVVLLGGTNDGSLAGNAAGAASIANFTTIYTSLVRQQRKTLVVINELPRGDGGAPAPGYRLGLYHWVRDVLAGWPGVIVVDPASAMSDPASAAWAPLPGYLRDGLHFGPRGAVVVGQAVAGALNGLFTPRPLLAVSAADAFNATSQPRGNLVTNAMMTGSVAASTYGAGSGNVPSGYLPVVDNGAGLSVTWSIVAAGNYACTQATVSGTPTAANPGVKLITPGFAASVASGDRISGAVAVQLDAGSSGVTAVSASTEVDAVSGAWASPSSGNYQLGPEMLAGVAPVAAITVPAGPFTSARMVMALRGYQNVPLSATVRFCQPTVRKLP